MIRNILIVLLFLFFVNVNYTQAKEYEPYKIEHLPQYKKTNITTVKITTDNAVILPNNAIKITFNSNFNSKFAKEGDFIDFSLQDGLSTVEGTCLLPCGTKIIGCITCIEKPKFFNRNAKVFIIFRKVLLPDGNIIPIIAYPFGKDNALKASSWAAVGKATAYTVGFYGTGAGLGAWIGAGSNAAGKGALAIGMPVGASIGLVLGIITPGLHFRAKCGKAIYIRLEDCLVIPSQIFKKDN